VLGVRLPQREDPTRVETERVASQARPIGSAALTFLNNSLIDYLPEQVH
jgi:hypothetical protein